MMNMRIRTLDLARGMAILCVVLMHTTLEGTYTPLEIGIGSLLHNAATVGVPVFFFLSGYLVVFDQQTAIGPYLGRKIERVLIPTWCWTIVFWMLLGIVGNDRSFDLTTLPLRLLFLTEPGHYYFVFVLMLLYPLAFWLRTASPGVCFRLAGAMLAVNLIVIAAYELAIWRSAAGALPADPLYRNPFAWSGFLFYGVAIGRGDPTMSNGVFAVIRQHRMATWLAVGLMLSVTAAETFQLFWKQAPGGQDYFKVASFGYEFIAMHLLLIGVQWLDQRALLVKPLLFLSKYSFFIYLVHLPLVPKLIQITTAAAAIRLPLLVTTCITFALCIGLPIALALPFMLVKDRLWMSQRLGRALGIPL